MEFKSSDILALSEEWWVIKVIIFKLQFVMRAYGMLRTIAKWIINNS